MSLDLDRFIDGLPKAELHMHIEGSLEPELMFKLAQRNQITLAYDTIDALRSAYNFSNLQDFLDIYYQGAQVLLTEDDFYDLGMDYFRRAHRDMIVHAEIFFDPQTHTHRGIDIGLVIKGLKRAADQARGEFGMTSGLILCILRHLSEDDGIKTLEAALPYRQDIIGIGLDSSELGHPPSKFTTLFAKARALGFQCVAHAGEEGPPDYIYQALDGLRIDRLDHGNRALEDKNLCDRLIDMTMTLTVCPLSNLKLCVVKSIETHPIKTMLDLGLKVTINSDDPAYFGGYVNDNYKALARAGLINKDDIIRLARHSFEGAFIDDTQKDTLIERLETYVAQMSQKG